MGTEIKRKEPTQQPPVVAAFVGDAYDLGIHVRPNTIASEKTLVFAAGQLVVDANPDYYLVKGFRSEHPFGSIKVSLEDAETFANAILDIVAQKRKGTV